MKILLFIILNLLFSLQIFAKESTFESLISTLSQQLKSNKYESALLTMRDIRALDVEIPNSFDFFEARALFETGKKVEAYTLFKTYLDNAGKSGKYFKPAIQYLLKAESAYKKDQNKIIVIDDVMYQNQPYKAHYWGNAVQYCRSLDLEGKGWQLSNKHQLEKLLTKNKNKGKNGEYFIRKEFVDNIKSSGWFWTSLKDKNDDSKAWSIFFIDGKAGWYKRNDVLFFTLCVRTEEGNKKAFIDSRIEEKKTNHLISIIGNSMWQDEIYTKDEKHNGFMKHNNGKMQDWEGAINYCKNLNLGGFSDWMLPTKERLVNLSKQKSSLINNTPAYYPYWSNLTDANNNMFAWVITFSDEITRQEIIEKKYHLPVRCVREIK